MKPQVAIKTHLDKKYMNFTTIGEGTYAVVFKARSIKTQELVAIK